MSIEDLAPSTKAVPLGSVAVEVGGLSLRRLTQLVAAYPELLGFVAGGTVDVAGLVVRGPDMALAMFAVGLRGPARRHFWQRAQARINDDALLGAFDNAAAGEQIDALSAIVDLTFRGERGGPFLQSLVAALAPKPPHETSATPTAESSAA